MGLGFKVPDFDRIVNTLSGGWAMRVAMARVILLSDGNANVHRATVVRYEHDTV